MASEVKMQLPDDLIQAHIRVAVIDALEKGGGNDKLIEAVVKAAMEEKTKGSYGRTEKTVFGQQVREMIRTEAKAIFKEWLGENRQQIREAFMKRLKKSPQKFVDGIVSTFLDTMADNFSFQIKWEPKDRDTY